MRDEHGLALPPVTIILPGGQELLGGMRGWRRAAAGEWLAEVTVPWWQELADGAVEAVEQHLALPSAHVRPVKGVSYSRVPNASARVRPTPDPAPSEPTWPPTGDRWRVRHERRPAGLTIRRVTVHHADCFIPGGSEILDGAQAKLALEQPGASACSLCGADSLRRS